MASNLPFFHPTADNAYHLVYPEGVQPDFNFAKLLAVSNKLEKDGRIEEACNMRYQAVQRLVDLIPDEDEFILDWEEENNRELILLLRKSAIDHFLVGDFEMGAGMMEMLLDMDPEDHLEITQPLAYSYLALEEYELFDEIINDISDKYPEKEILTMWSEYRKTGKIPHGEYVRFKKTFPVFHEEFTAADHPVNPEYVKDIESERPTKAAVARELWLQTEHLWRQFPGFIEALQNV